MNANNTPDTIAWKLHLRSDPASVFELLNTDAGRARFWAESAIEADGVITFQFINGITTSGRLLERVRPHRWSLEYFSSTVVFELQDDGNGGTDLELTNTGFAPEEYLEILPGWLNVLLPLKAAADFRIDLRNHDPERTWDQGYVD